MTVKLAPGVTIERYYFVEPPLERKSSKQPVYHSLVKLWAFLMLCVMLSGIFSGTPWLFIIGGVFLLLALGELPNPKPSA